MNNIKHKIETLINNAIDKFNQNEQYLISRDLSERCICSKFATYLEKELFLSEFNDYIVDVEYNRGNGGNECAAKMLRGKKIVVDLIVHKRGYNPETGFDNLVCIEMKKSKYNRGSDLERLKIMTNPYCGFNYKAGFMIIIVSDKRHDKFGLEITESF